MNVVAGNFVSDYSDLDVDTAMINLTLKSGAFALIENCRATTYGYDQRVEAFGTKANAKFENVFEDSITISNKEGTNSNNPLYFFLERYEKAYNEESTEFISALTEKREPNVGIKDAIESAILALAAKKSLLEKRTVKISEIKEEYNIKG